MLLTVDHRTVYRPTTLVGRRSASRPLDGTAAVYIRPSGVFTLAVESRLLTGSENWRSTSPGVDPSRCPGDGLDETSVAWASALAGRSAAPRPAARAATSARDSHARPP